MNFYAQKVPNATPAAPREDFATFLSATAGSEIVRFTVMLGSGLYPKRRVQNCGYTPSMESVVETLTRYICRLFRLDLPIPASLMCKTEAYSNYLAMWVAACSMGTTCVCENNNTSLLFFLEEGSKLPGSALGMIHVLTGG